MAIGKISGSMLNNNLERQGVDLAFQSNLLYLDVNNLRVGVINSSPQYAFDSSGNVKLAKIIILGNTITSNTGVVNFGSNANITVTGGANKSILNTDGNGNLKWSSLSELASIIDTVFIANLSTGNAVISGGYISALSNITVTTGNVGSWYAAALNSSAANISGPLYATSINTANAVVTGGYINGLANLTATTAQTTNLSTGNAVITGGYINNLANLTATTAQATNLSSGNVVVTGGYITGLANANAAVGTFATLNASAANVSGPLFATSLNTANAVVSGGYIYNLANISVSTANVITGNINSLNATTGNITNLTGTTVNAAATTTTTLNTTTANITTGNVNTLNTTTGNITNLTGSTVNVAETTTTRINSTAANITTGNIDQLNTTTANITTGNINTLNTTTGNITNLTGSTVNAAATTTTTLNSTTANITTGNINTLNTTTGNITNLTGSTVNAAATTSTVLNSTAANITTGNINTLNTTTGNITNLTGSTVNVAETTTTRINSTTANIVIGNVNQLNTATGNISNLTGSTVNVADTTTTRINSTTANITTGNVNQLNTATGNITNLAGLTVNVAETTTTRLNSTTANITTGNVNQLNTATGNITTLGVSTATITTLNSTFSNITTAEVVTGNINQQNTVTGNITNLRADNFSSPNVLITSGTLDNVEITGSGNITLGGNIIARWLRGNVDGRIGNFSQVVNAVSLNAGGNSYIATSGVQLQNVRVTSNTITSTSGNLIISADKTDANHVVRFDSISAIGLPIGTYLERPGDPDLGYLRYNSDIGTIEWWTGYSWGTATNTITSEILYPDGVNNVLTLGQIASTDGVLVNINGTIQQAGVAYTVNLNQITFTEAPLVTDIIEIRYLAAGVAAANYYGGDVGGNVHILATTQSSSTTTGALIVDGGVGIAKDVHVAGTIYGTVVGTINVAGGINGTIIGNTNPASGAFTTITTAGDISAGGNIVPTANVVYTLGNTDYRFKELWLAGSTIYLGAAVISEVNGVVNLPAGSTVGGVTVDDSLTQINSSLGTLYANAATQSTAITNLIGNAGAQATSLNSIAANTGAYYTYANANIGTLYNGNVTTNANLGAYQTYANANIGTLYNGNVTTNANLGAYQTYANANVVAIQSNLGAYQTYANANVVAIQANLGAFYNYANSKIGTNTNSNLVVVATTNSTSTTTGALIVAGGAGIAGNVTANNFSVSSSGIAPNTGIYQSGVNGILGFSAGTYKRMNLYGLGGLGIGNNITAASLLELNITSVPIGIGTPTATNGIGIYNSGGTWAPGYGIVSNVNINSLRSTTIDLYDGTDTGSVATASTLYIEGAPIGSSNGAGTVITNPYALYIASGAAYFGGNLKTIGNIVAASTAPATSTTTGALVVKGGAGIAGNLVIATTGDVSANIGLLFNSNISTQANLGLLFNSNISTQANLGAYQIWSNSNAASQATSINAINANIGAYQTYANANIATIQANLGAYQTYANANIATIQANLGAYQTYANANVVAIQANLGAYQTWANANVAGLQTSINSLQTGANTNTAAYLSKTITVGNITATGTTVLQGNVQITGEGEFITNNLIVGGNLFIKGNTTTIDSVKVTTNDLAYIAAANAVSAAAADGAGLITPYAALTFKNATTSWQSNVSITPSANVTQNLGTSSNYWGTVFAGNLVSNSHLVSAATVSTSTSTGALVVTGGVGIGGNLYVGGSSGNAAILTGNVNITGNILPAGANITYNLGSTTQWWNTFYGVSTQAKYADLAENYVADATYAPGTVVVFGGSAEITVTNQDHDPRIAGVISTNPAYLMNAAMAGLPVALQGRAPCLVLGPVDRGDLLVSSGLAGVAQKLDKSCFEHGCVIGKSLENIASSEVQLIEIVVGLR